jgi:PAS domain S-box-containing protein
MEYLPSMASASGLWRSYVTLLNKNILRSAAPRNEISDSRNRLFVLIIVYFLPLSIFVIIPGVIVSILAHLYLLAAVDVVSLVMIVFIAFSRRLPTFVRKYLFIAIIYLVALALFYYLGSFGPGMLYFLAVTFFTSLIFPGYRGYLSVVANAVICTVFGFLFYYKVIPSALPAQYSLSSWIAVSSNLVVLSAIVSILLPRLYHKLSRSFERFEIVAQATSDTLMDWDMIKGTMKFNSGLTKMFGYLETNIQNSDAWWISNVHPQDREAVLRKFSEFVGGEEESTQLESRFRCEDATYKHIFLRIAKLKDRSGTPVRLIGVIQDVSEIRRYIEAIEEQNSKLREIAWIQSHKFRSPVATILGLSPLLRTNIVMAADYKVIVDGICESCLQLDTMIKEVNELTSTIKEIRNPVGGVSTVQ